MIESRVALADTRIMLLPPLAIHRVPRHDVDGLPRFEVLDRLESCTRVTDVRLDGLEALGVG
jgi:hypothetical protein